MYCSPEITERKKSLIPLFCELFIGKKYIDVHIVMACLETEERKVLSGRGLPGGGLHGGRGEVEVVRQTPQRCKVRSSVPLPHTPSPDTQPRLLLLLLHGWKENTCKIKVG